MSHSVHAVWTLPVDRTGSNPSDLKPASASQYTRAAKAVRAALGVLFKRPVTLEEASGIAHLAYREGYAFLATVPEREDAVQAAEALERAGVGVVRPFIDAAPEDLEAFVHRTATPEEVFAAASVDSPEPKKAQTEVTSRGMKLCFMFSLATHGEAGSVLELLCNLYMNMPDDPQWAEAILAFCDTNKWAEDIVRSNDCWPGA